MKREELVNILLNHTFYYVVLGSSVGVKRTKNASAIKYFVENLYNWHEVEDFEEEYHEAFMLSQKGYNVIKLISTDYRVVFIRINKKWLNN